MLQKTGALGKQIGVAPRRQCPADDKTQDGHQGKSPGLPPAPLPGDDQRQERDQHNEEQHLEDNSEGEGFCCVLHIISLLGVLYEPLFYGLTLRRGEWQVINRFL